MRNIAEKHFHNSLNLKHYSKPALLNILFKIISLMAPKMFLTRLVSVAVVSKLYTSRFVFLFSRRYFLLRNFLEIVKLFTRLILPKIK